MNDSFYRALEHRIAVWARPTGPLVHASAHFALGTEKGPVRKDNQDRVVAVRTGGTNSLPGSVRLGVLCDGMGGMVEGARCAELAIGAFAASVIRERVRLEPLALLSQAVEAANSRVHAAYGGRGGTTLSAVLLTGQSVFMCHVGDSRIYSVNPSGSLRQESTDDTIQAQLTAIGAAPSQPTSDHSRIVQYVGMGTDLQPHISRLACPPGSKLVLMSDGAYRPSATVFDQISRNSETPLELVQRLVALARWTGGHDNASALVVATRVEDDRESSRDEAVVEVWSPAGKLELIIVADRAGNEARSESVKSQPPQPGTDRASNEARSDSVKSQLPQPGADTKRGGGGRRKGRGRKSDRGQAHLPIGPEKGKLSIEVKDHVEPKDENLVLRPVERSELAKDDGGRTLPDASPDKSVAPKDGDAAGSNRGSGNGGAPK
jgi:serine/threonine protein phosphatase PrpC